MKKMSTQIVGVFFRRVWRWRCFLDLGNIGPKIFVEVGYEYVYIYIFLHFLFLVVFVGEVGT